MSGPWTIPLSLCLSVSLSLCLSVCLCLSLSVRLRPSLLLLSRTPVPHHSPGRGCTKHPQGRGNWRARHAETQVNILIRLLREIGAAAVQRPAVDDDSLGMEAAQAVTRLSRAQPHRAALGIPQELQQLRPLMDAILLEKSLQVHKDVHGESLLASEPTEEALVQLHMVVRQTGDNDARGRADISNHLTPPLGPGADLGTLRPWTTRTGKVRNWQHRRSCRFRLSYGSLQHSRSCLGPAVQTAETRAATVAAAALLVALLALAIARQLHLAVFAQRAVPARRQLALALCRRHCESWNLDETAEHARVNKA